MKTTAMTRKWIKPRKITINGRTTSLRIEDSFYFWLRQVAAEIGTPATKLVADIDRNRDRGRSLSSAVRVFVTGYLHDNPLP
jgi:predicted DNA-binding ribbon-helix-helix protein